MDSHNSFTCPVCGNTDIHSIGYLNGKPYCRRCISFKGEEVEHKPSYPKKAPIHLEYELSHEQKELSDKLVENYKKGIDSLVFAVCGSGKTEITLDCISYALKCGDRVGFVIPRKDVVREIKDRLVEIFPKNSVVAVYGGHTNKLIADITVLTTHQLYRYKNYFNLIVMDEIDAFPYKGNNTLKQMLKTSLVGNMIMLSATPDAETVKLFQTDRHEILRLDKRFHGYPLPIPKVVSSKLLYLPKYLWELGKILKRTKQCFIFCPTIKICEDIFKITNLFYKGGERVHSKIENREAIIDKFRRNEYRYLVTTAVLERGVTVKDLQVIIYLADHKIYDEASLVQISGRVGRKKDAPVGEVIFIVKKSNFAIEEAIRRIEESNSVSNMF